MDHAGAAAFKTLYLAGLPRDMTPDELSALCRPFGEVVDARMERDPQTGIAFPFGFVSFAARGAAVRAAQALHGTRFRGDVLSARPVSS